MKPTKPRPSTAERRYPSFRTTLVRVLLVQVVALVLLWIIQIRYHV